MHFITRSLGAGLALAIGAVAFVAADRLIFRAPVQGGGGSSIPAMADLPEGCTDGQVPKWDSGAWVCGSDDDSGAGGGDNLGTHVATQNLDLDGHALVNASGLSATNASAIPIQGVSTDSIGVRGVSTSSIGVQGESVDEYGVHGYSANFPGVMGRSMSSFGVRGASTSGHGVQGESVDEYGVFGYSENQIGVYGLGQTHGVYGRSDQATGHGVYCAGTLCGGTVAWSPASDERLKENIRPVENALSRLMAIRGVAFDWREEASAEGADLGVIAQEVAEQFPELVHDGPEGYLSVRTANLVGPLIEAMREQQAMIEALRAEIAALRDATDDGVRGAALRP